MIDAIIGIVVATFGLLLAIVILSAFLWCAGMAIYYIVMAFVGPFV